MTGADVVVGDGQLDAGQIVLGQAGEELSPASRARARRGRRGGLRIMDPSAIEVEFGGQAQRHAHRGEPYPRAEPRRSWRPRPA